MHPRTICLFLLAGPWFAVGCADRSGSEGPAAKPRPSFPRGNQGRKRAVRTIATGDMKFADRIVGEKLRRFDAFAHRVAQPTWYRRPYKTLDKYAARGVYLAEWATFPGRVRMPVNYHGTREVHCISLSANFDADHPDAEKWKEIVGITVNARWKPEGTGWSARLKYRTFHGRDYPRSGQPDEEFHFSFYYYRGKSDEKAPPRSRIEFRRDGSASYSQSYVFGGKGQKYATLYEFAVSVAAKTTRDKRREVPDADVRRILASPEAMRDFGVAAFEALAKKIETDIPSGKALRRSPMYDRKPEYGENLDRLISDRKLADKEKRKVLEDARRDVRARIETLREHYKAMYAALEKTLPLKVCLDAANANLFLRFRPVKAKKTSTSSSAGS